MYSVLGTQYAVRPAIELGENRKPITGDSATETISPDAFHAGMVVRHPEYGLGKITAASGVGPKRTATVAFASAAGEKKFLLVHSRLAPARV